MAGTNDSTIRRWWPGRDVTDHSLLIERLAEQAESLGVRSLTPEERHLIVAVTGYGLICNGGFFWLYQGFTEIELLIDGFEALGLPKAAEACRLSLEALPNGAPFFKLEDQAVWLEEQNEAEAPFLDRWDDLTSAITTIQPQAFEECIDAYVRAHPELLNSH